MVLRKWTIEFSCNYFMSWTNYLHLNNRKRAYLSPGMRIRFLKWGRIRFSKWGRIRIRFQHLIGYGSGLNSRITVHLKLNLFFAVFIDQSDNSVLKHQLYWLLCQKNEERGEFYLQKIDRFRSRLLRGSDPAFFEGRIRIEFFFLAMVGSGFG